MSTDPVLLIGGYGVVGRRTARCLRDAHPAVPLLIGGRDLAKAEEVAAEVGGAEGVVLDLAADDLGLGDDPLGAVAVFPKDDRLAGLRHAQARGVPHLSISGGLTEISPEVAAHMHEPAAAPVVLGAEWLVGATTVPALQLATDFGRVFEIAIGAVLDEQDTGGPATAVDLDRLTTTMPAALTRRDGAHLWRGGEDARADFRAVDGTVVDAVAFSPFDVVASATATGAPNVRFDLATGVSSTRRRGGQMSTEIVIELSGEDHGGRSLRTRHAVVGLEGQMPLTALGAAMVLERLVGLDGGPAVPAGLHFPYQLLEPTAYLSRLEEAGAEIIELEVV